MDNKKFIKESSQPAPGSVVVDHPMIGKIIRSLGDPGNQYIIQSDQQGTWWIEHTVIGSGEPLKQFLERLLNQ